MDRDMNPLELLEEILSEKLKLIETRLPTFYVVAKGNDRICGLFVKTIKGDIEVFNDSIRKYSFGPEIVHKVDHRTIQTLLRENELDRCYYIVHSVDFKKSRLVSVVLYNSYFERWVG
jgi:hypothetical protein